MQHAVEARPKLAKLPDLWRSLNNGAVSSQQPDGGEIVASMRCAVVKGDTVKWYETCRCNLLLKHEASTVHAQFFTHITIEPVSNPPKLVGDSFWDYLHEYSKLEHDGGAIANATREFRYVPIRTL